MDKNPESQIRKFLEIFQMPDCGTRTMPVLHKLGDLSGVDEVRKKPVHYSMHPGNYTGVNRKLLHTQSREIGTLYLQLNTAFPKMVVMKESPTRN